MAKIKYLTREALNKLITKLGLKREYKDCFNCKINYEFYIKEQEQNNIKKVITLDNQMNVELENENKIYFLVKESFDYNKPIITKQGYTRPITRTSITQIEILD